MNIFISYGHDGFSSLAERLKHDLDSMGHNVWFDKEKLKGSAEWETEIEKNIISSDWLILLMTNHSVRRPDGVCLDEVSVARYMNKKILPIMIQNVMPPFCIARIQWLDMQNNCCDENGVINELKYAEKLEQILQIVEGIFQINHEGSQSNLLRSLSPLDNDVYIESIKQKFYGRNWLFDKYDNWVTSPSSPRAFMITGQAGIGKTAFVVALSSMRPEIVGIHFCKYNDNDRSNPKRALMSIAYHLSTQIPEYSAQLMLLNDLNRLEEKSVTRLFEYLFIEPLNKIPSRDKTSVIIIDALDEAAKETKNELLDIIAMEFDKTPSWLKLLVTSRPENQILRKMAKYNPIVIEKNKECDDDILEFLTKELVDVNCLDKEQKIFELSKKCQGSFLYAKEVMRNIKDKHYDLSNVDSFPKGLAGIYESYFNRLFSGDMQFYKTMIRPVLEVLVASFEPLTLELVQKISMVDEYEFDDVIEAISSLFPLRNNTATAMHKSLYDWIIDAEKAGQYRVSLKRGHKKLSDYYLQMNKNEKLTAQVIKYTTMHCIFAEEYNSAYELLINNSFQNTRIKSLGLDTALREYFSEIYKLKEKEPTLCLNVLRSECFLSIIKNNRAFLYNSGLFFEIKECGFDQVAETIISNYSDAELIVSIAYYFYITERFKQAELLFSRLIDFQFSTFPERLKAGVFNTLALCYRKYADFDKAKDYFLLAESTAVHSSDYERSIAVVNLGKIAYHQLDWELAKEYSEKAIKILRREYDNCELDDDVNSLRLFVAEYHRLFAEAVIWHGDVELAKKHLSEAAKLYSINKARDRYYVRYLYTGILVDIIGKRNIDLRRIDEVKSLAASKYDKSQILYYEGLYFYLKDDVVGSKEKLREALVYTEDINASLEVGEITMLLDLCGEHIKTNNNNRYIEKWCKYVKNFIEELK